MPFNPSALFYPAHPEPVPDTGKKPGTYEQLQWKADERIFLQSH